MPAFPQRFIVITLYGENYGICRLMFAAAINRVRLNKQSIRPIHYAKKSVY